MSDLIPSKRETTSSRTPGKVNEGTVWIERTLCIACPECGGMKSDAVPPGRHAPHFHKGTVVNCIGQEIVPWP